MSEEQPEPIEPDPDSSLAPSPPEDDENLPEPTYGNGQSLDILWVKEGANTVLVTIYAYRHPTESRIRSITFEPSPLDRLLKHIEIPIETLWSVPTKEQLVDYRNKSSRYIPQARGYLVQSQLLQDMIIRNHLLELKLITGKDKFHEIDLPKNKQGHLSTAAMTTINGLHSSIIDILYTKFVDNAAILV